MKRSPAMLFALLKDYRDRNDLPMDVMAERLGIKKLTLHAYFFGRPVKHLEPSFIRAAARMLGIPPVQAFLVAGIIEPEDILEPCTADDRLIYVAETLRRDPFYAGFVPGEEEWAALSKNVRVLIALLYEQACRTQVLSDPLPQSEPPSEV